MRETQIHSLGQEDPLEKGMAPSPVFLPGEFHGQRSLVDYSPGDHKETEQLTHTLDVPKFVIRTNAIFLTPLFLCSSGSKLGSTLSTEWSS